MIITKQDEDEVNTMIQASKSQEYTVVHKLYNIKKRILASPLFLLKVCGYNKFIDPIYSEWENELLQNKKRRLYAKPRGTYKTTLYSVGYPAWRLLRDPNLRVKIIGRTVDDAKVFLDEIRDNIFGNPLIQMIFGDLVVEKTQGATGFNLKNRTDFSRRGKNIMVHGMRSSITGNHCDLMIIDDPSDMSDTTSPTVRKKRQIVFQQNLKVVDEYPHGEIIIVMTRKHKEDIAGYIIDTVNPNLKMIDGGIGAYYTSVETPYNPDGTLRFPTFLSESVIQRNKAEMGTYIFSHEMMNEPMSDEDLVFYESDIIKHGFNYNLIYNSILDKEHRNRFSVYMYIDLAISESAKADNTAICVVAHEKLDLNRQHCDNFYLLEGKKIKANPTKVYNEIIALYEKWDSVNSGMPIDWVGIEKNGFQIEWIRGFQKYCNDNGYSKMRVKGVENRSNKRARILGLQPIIESGKLRFALDYRRYYNDYVNEMLLYPTTEHDDCADSLAGCIELIKKDFTRVIRSI